MRHAFSRSGRQRADGGWSRWHSTRHARVGFLHGHGHTQEQAQAVVEVVEDAREALQTARLQNWMLKLMLAQTALFLTIAVGAIVVAGVVWG